MAFNDPGKAVTAIGGLGTAAFGLVDASKPILGINHIGFPNITRTVTPLLPAGTMAQKKIIATLQANWMNGTDLASQKAIAKSLIKLNLNATNAAQLATATGVDSVVLQSIATKIAAADPAKPLTSAESDVYGRFDLIVTALLDEAYQRSDQFYRNCTRLIAAAVAVALAVVGGRYLMPPLDWKECALVGLLATPLAPIAKDISTALATAVNTLQLVKK